jgi:hypothetical protein
MGRVERSGGQSAQSGDQLALSGSQSVPFHGCIAIAGHDA